MSTSSAYSGRVGKFAEKMEAFTQISQEEAQGSEVVEQPAAQDTVIREVSEEWVVPPVVDPVEGAKVEPVASESPAPSPKVVDFVSSSEPKAEVVLKRYFEQEDNLVRGTGVSNTSGVRIENLVKSLGISIERGKDVSILHLAKSNVTPLEPVPAKDSNGRISEILDSIQGNCGIVVVPEETTKIPSWVTPKRHGSFEYKGKKYFFPYGESQQEGKIKELLEQCVAKFKEGETVKESMFTTFTYEGEQYKTLRFTQTELSDIVTYLSNYDAKLVEVGKEELYLVAGDYIYA